MREAMALVTANNAKEELWAAYACWGSIGILHLMLLTWFTGQVRVFRNVIHSEEDRRFMKEPYIIVDPRAGGHPDVDRIRSAHRSGLEAIVLYLIITPIWITSSPPLFLAKILLHSFPILCLTHTVLYMKIIDIRNSCTSFLFTISYCILGYMAVSCVIYFAYYDIK